jgi:dTDP-4-dehydrorhamnose reductase
MRVLVTGARGLVGGPLVRRLSSAHEVLGLDLPELDVRDAAACSAAVSRFRPDRVMHLAAWTDVDGAERDPKGAAAVNDAGTRNVASACRAAGAAMLYVSTDYVFDGRKTSPWREDDPVAPLSAYGRTKLAGEEHVRALAPSWWIVRCQSIYGAGRKSFVDAILNAARAGTPLSVVADQRVQPSWCEDVAEAIAAVLLRAPHGVYLAANSGSCTWRECAQAAVDLAGLRVDVAAKTAAQHAAERAAKGLVTAPRPGKSLFDCSKLTEATGHVMRPWRDALAAYLAVPAAKEAPR